MDAASELLAPVEAAAPSFHVATEVGRRPSQHEHVSATHAELRLRDGGRAYLDRGARTVRFVVPRPLSADELVHPYLAPAAAIIARWMGRESLHAGALASDGTAWALIGDRESGKSSTLAWLQQRGLGLVCDDMLVLDELRPLPGPRSIDLRPDAARRLGLGMSIGVAGTRERWRHQVPPVSPDLRVAGFVFLAWGERVELEPLRGRRKLSLLLEHRGVRLAPAHRERFVDYATLPAWRLSRPPGWASMEPAGSRLLELLTG